MTAMKVLTLHQPWATLIALGVKTIETRPNKTNVRGRIAIHAAARKPTVNEFGHARIGDYHVLTLPGREPSLTYRYVNGSEIQMPLGAIVATAELVDCIPMVDDAALGDLRPAITVVQDAGGTGAFLWHKGKPGWPYEQGDSLRDQMPYGHFAPGRWAWLLEDIQPLAEPVPFKGGQGWSRSWDGNS